MAVSSLPLKETVTECLLVDRWKLSYRQNGQIQTLKDIPTAYVNSSSLVWVNAVMT